MDIRQRSLGPAALTLLAALALAGCDADASRSDADRATIDSSDELTIALPWPWSSREMLSKGYLNGLELALEEVNDDGGLLGRPVRVEQFDDRESVAEGRLIAQQIAEDPGIVAVIGHLQSSVSVPAAAIYDLSGVVMVAPTSTDPELTRQGYRSVFRLIFTDRQVGRQLAERAAEQGYRRASIYYIRNQYGRGIANAFEERALDLGITVVDRQSHDPGVSANVRRVGEMIRQWNVLEVDALLLATEPAEAADLLKEARRMDFKAPAIGGDALATPEFLLVAGAAGEGTVIASPFHADEARSRVATFTSAYRERYGQMPDAGAALGYDALHLVAQAIRKADSHEPARIAEALRLTAGWSGVTGDIQFDEKGDPLDRKAVLVVVEDGGFAVLHDAARNPAVEPE